jgi:RimJ/RimL family protein N-acetyltransferase
VRDGFHRLSPEAIYHRFFQTKTSLTDDELRYLTELDFRDHVALVATVELEGREQIVAVARFVRLKPPAAVDRAEIAFVVGDEYQHRGIGTLLMAHLATMACHLGYSAFEAEVLPDNGAMLRVFEHSGLPIVERGGEGMIHVTLARATASSRRRRRPRVTRVIWSLSTTPTARSITCRSNAPETAHLSLITAPLVVTCSSGVRLMTADPAR